MSLIQFTTTFETQPLADLEAVDLISFFQNPLLWYALLAFVGAVWLLKIFLWLTRRYGRYKSAFEKDILLVQVPKQSLLRKPEEGGEMNLQEIQEAIGTMDVFYSSVAGLKAQRGFMAWLFGRGDHVGFEIVCRNDQIMFYIAVPKNMRYSLEQQLLAQFPYAYIEEVPDYNIFSPQCAISSAALKFVKPYFFPIKSYKQFEADPLNALTNVLSKVRPDDGVAIQFLARSARGGWHRMGTKVASIMQQGKNYSQAYRDAKAGIFIQILEELWEAVAGLFSAVSGMKEKEGLGEKHYALSPMEQEMVKGFEEKTSKAGMDVNIRIVVAATDQAEAEEYLDTIVNAFNQYSIYEYGNGFQPVKIRNKNRFVHDFIFRHFDENVSVLLNTDEMAGLYHLPLPSLETPKILWLAAKKAPPPVNLPKEGVILGSNFYRGIETVVRMSRDDRRRHAYIIGQTGVGKSTLLENMAIQDIKNGEGVCVIDPHGDMVEHILEHIPKERVDDVVYFDPGDIERPMALNLLEYDDEHQKSFVINEMLAIFDKLYDLRQTGGPIFEQYMRNALMLIMADPESGSTLMEVSKVLSDEDFRKYKLSKCDNLPVRDFWIKEAEKAGGEAALANMVPYITSKLTAFIANDIMRPIIAQQKSCFNVRQAMDKQQILLLNLSKGKLGEMNSALLGMVMIGKILMSALSRVDTPMEQRKDFYLYIDEFQNFITDTIGIILSEARKYRLSLIMAHQFVAQLVKDSDTRVRDAVFGNVGTKIAYRVGVDDSEMIGKQFAPVFNEYDVINIPKYTAYLRLLVNNENPPAFNLHPYPLKPGDANLAKAIKQLSRLKYGRDRRVIEAEILERVKKVEGGYE